MKPLIFALTISSLVVLNLAPLSGTALAMDTLTSATPPNRANPPQSSSSSRSSGAFSKFAGTYRIVDCVLQKNFAKQPKDYYCRSQNLTVEEVSDHEFQIHYLDELGQIQSSPLLREYSHQKDNGDTDEAKFTTTDHSTRWERSVRARSESVYINDMIEFSFDKDRLFMRHAFAHYAPQGYKFYTWDYEIEKIENK